MAIALKLSKLRPTEKLFVIDLVVAGIITLLTGLLPILDSSGCEGIFARSCPVLADGARGVPYTFYASRDYSTSSAFFSLSNLLTDYLVMFLLVLTGSLIVSFILRAKRKNPKLYTALIAGLAVFGALLCITPMVSIEQNGCSYGLTDCAPKTRTSLVFPPVAPTVYSLIAPTPGDELMGYLLTNDALHNGYNLAIPLAILIIALLSGMAIANAKPQTWKYLIIGGASAIVVVSAISMRRYLSDAEINKQFCGDLYLQLSAPPDVYCGNPDLYRDDQKNGTTLKRGYY